MVFLGILCVILLVAVCILWMKIVLLQRAADELRAQFAQRLSSDTNVGIDLTTADRSMRALATDMDRQLKLLRRERARYLQGDRELKDAVTGISHDLRTPLTAICGYLELLERQDLAEPARQYLSVIAERVDALKLLTEELFRYSVVLSGDSYTQRESVSLNRAIEECAAAYYGALKAKGITPEISMPEEPVVRQLNRNALARILGNLMSNAVKYSGGDLRITLTEQGITIENSAPGLNEVLTGRLFDRFYTVEAAQNSSGLGLAIARVLTEQMGGSLTARYHSGCLTLVLDFSL